MVRSVIMMAALLLGGLTARAQSLYVIHNGDNYLSHNASTGAVNTSRETTFDPTTCFWTVSNNYLRPVNSSGTVLGNLYLRPRSANRTYSLNTSTNTNYATWNGLSDGGQPYYNRYLRLNGTTWEMSTSTSNRGTLRLVTVSTVSTTSTPPTISGADVLTATGNSTYTATGAAYQQGGYTNYRFNSTDHFFNGNTSITPAAATIGSPSWTLTDNPYATVNSSGVVNVGTLPETDITLTLSATVSVTGGTPAAPDNTKFTATKVITIQGTKPPAPVISVSGSTATLSTDAVGSTTIRYTLDGTDPTASTGTVYSGAIDLSASGTSPVTIKAVTVRSGNASDVSTETVTLTLDAPVITVDGAAGTATITAAAGTTIYYTTNGTTPTTSSTPYTGALSGLSPMTTIKAIAVKDGWNDSPMASEIVRIPSGVSGGEVILFDYEDHSWSYYSDADCPIRSLNPADVKITYYGDGIVMTGNADYTASSSDYIQPGNANYVGGAKVNVGGEDENTFIYYKTLERGDATQTAWTFSSGNQSSAASRCPYSPIPNPFQVRPTYGSRGSTDANNFTGWRGFQCWRLKRVSGGSVYSAASGGSALSVGAVVNAETAIYFAPNSEYGMEVDFEAVWARAYLIKGNQSGDNAILSQNVGVERNFMTLTAGTNFQYNGANGSRRITNVGYPVTISCYYPSGEAPANTSSSVGGASNQNLTLGADVKFENVGFYSLASYTLTANGHNLIVGRGCSGGSTVNHVRGMEGASSDALDYTIRLESGTYTYFYLVRGSTSSSASQVVYSGNVSAKAVLGSDYDRAKEDNGKLSIAPSSGNIYGGAAMQISASTNRNNITFDWTVKSGTFHSGILGNASGGDQSIYLGSSQAGNGGNLQYIGKRRITVEGGNMAGIAGAMNNVSTNYGVNDGTWAVMMRIKNGTIRSSVYGAAAFAQAVGDRVMVITGGTINGWVAGGCNGTTTGSGGTLNGDTKIYVGGNSQVVNTNADPQIGTSTGGNIFGAGSGYSADYEIGEVNNSNIVVADNATISKNVFGGGNYGYVGSGYASNIYIAGGTVKGNVFGGANQRFGQTVNVTVKGGNVKGGVYGGSNVNGTINNNVTMNISGGLIEQGAFGGGYGTNSNSCNVTGTVGITMTGGTVLSGLYGGGNVNSTIGSTVTMQINGGQVGTPESNANIHGGGYGSLTAVTGNVSVTLGASTSAADSATVNGDVFGGSALGRTNTGNATNTTTVTMNKALVNGNVFGGALGNGAVVNGKITVTVNGGRVNGNIFGGGDAASYSPNSNHPVVNMTGGQATNVFGGGKGNTAAVTGNPQVTLSGNAHVTGNVYGGGDAAPVTGQTNVQLRD